jgi:glycosyltransferase involved in cell wall biosynthesis
MKVSIIIPTYNRNDLLVQTLQGLVNMDTAGIDWEVILVDNAGNDETAQVSARFSESLPLKFIVERAPGKNNALKTALNHATGELLIFTDDDVLADPAWVRSMVDAAGRWRDADLFGGRILPKYPEGKTVQTIRDVVFMRIAYVIADRDLPEGEFPAGKIWGPNMMVRRRVFDQGLMFNTDIGPSGSNYVMGSETEFLQRAGDAGHIAVYVPSALVYHQIRPEQLTHSWLFGRAFRMGRSSAYLNRSVPVLKLEKWMLRDIIALYARYMYSYAFGTDTEKLENGIKFHKSRGYIYQCYKGRNTKT